MGGVNLDEVESDLLASFNGCNKGIFDALYVVLGHRDGFRVIIGEGYIARTVNYAMSRVNENMIAERGLITDRCLANRLHPQGIGVWGP